jgi:hypothetical protein
VSDPHNPERYGETWPQYKIDAYLEEMEDLRPFVVLSGGWAWHFMSPPGHVELKHAHDHKDLDIHVPPRKVGLVVGMLKHAGFEKVRTRYDKLPSEEDFRRYEKVIDDGEHDPFRLTVDFFVKDVPEREIEGWRIVEPATLLTFYSTIHSSGSCFAVQAASKLLERGIDPLGREELVEIPGEEP